MQVPYRYSNGERPRIYFSFSEFTKECGKSISLEEVVRLLDTDTIFLNWIYRYSQSFNKEIGKRLTAKTVPEWMQKFQQELPCVQWKDVVKEVFGEERYKEIDNLHKQAEQERLEQERERQRLEQLRASGQGEKAGERRVETISGVEYAFRWCPAGRFMMGSPEDEEERCDDERQHEVRLTRGFWLLETPVTQLMWQSVMGNNPSMFKGENLPVEQVSWDDCQDFIVKLNKSFESSLRFRLPSEAEWEYACRAGTTTPFNFGGVLNGKQANCDGNHPYGTVEEGPYLVKTTRVKSYSPNAWGLYDMHGNVKEWCNDWYDEDYYTNSPSTDPKGPDSGLSRVSRGMSWINFAQNCRSASRYWNVPAHRNGDLGFRLALSSTH